jgi:hypothetical protein
MFRFPSTLPASPNPFSRLGAPQISRTPLYHGGAEGGTDRSHLEIAGHVAGFSWREK